MYSCSIVTRPSSSFGGNGKIVKPGVYWCRIEVEGLREVNRERDGQHQTGCQENGAAH
jgi:hypothetical protein